MQNIAQLQSHAVFPEVALETAAAFLDKIVPVEEQAAKIITGDFIVTRVLA